MYRRYFICMFMFIALPLQIRPQKRSFLDFVHAYHGNKKEIKQLHNPKLLAFIEKLTRDSSSKITLSDICKLHHLLYRGTHAHQAGQLRTTAVRVNGMIPPHASRVKTLMNQLISWVNTTTEHPLKASTDFHLKFVDIHPFRDGNGRTARTLLAILLLKNGYPAPSFIPRERKEYSRGINRALIRKTKRLYNKIMFDAVKRSLVSIKGKY